jgi:hypothetical protein
MDSHRIKIIKQEITPLRQQLLNHPLYTSMQSLDQLQVFMEHHVYAVWDFMSLLKSLQRDLTCIDIPWVPKGSPQTRYLINEIVLGEESDVDEKGNRTSHFELYIKAMKQAGCNLGHIHEFVNNISKHISVEKSLALVDAPKASVQFVNDTFAFINSGKTHVRAGVFTFGREDLIPGMFMKFVEELNKQEPDKVSVFKYYLERHIEVDGDHHSHLGYQMMDELCGDDNRLWEECLVGIRSALQSRINLWSAIHEKVAERSLVM